MCRKNFYIPIRQKRCRPFPELWAIILIIFGPCCSCVFIFTVHFLYCVRAFLCYATGAMWCLFFGVVTQTLRAAASVRDQCCLNGSFQWCQISRSVKVAPVWYEGQQHAGLEAPKSVRKVLTHYAGTSYVRSGSSSLLRKSLSLCQLW